MTTSGTAQAARSSRGQRGQQALDWWRAHCDPNAAGDPSPRKPDPGVRARIRRARSATDALLVPAVQELIRRLGHAPSPDRCDDPRLTAAANLARVLAHVKEHDPGKRPMQAAGWPKFPGEGSGGGEERPRLSEERFRRLLQTDPGEEAVTAFVRLITLLGGSVNVPALAEDFLDWHHPYRGDLVRRRWAFDYYAATPAAPAESPTSHQETDA